MLPRSNTDPPRAGVGCLDLKACAKEKAGIDGSSRLRQEDPVETGVVEAGSCRRCFGKGSAAGAASYSGISMVLDSVPSAAVRHHGGLGGRSLQILFGRFCSFVPSRRSLLSEDVVVMGLAGVRRRRLSPDAGADVSPRWDDSVSAGCHRPVAAVKKTGVMEITGGIARIEQCSTRSLCYGTRK